MQVSSSPAPLGWAEASLAAYLDTVDAHEATVEQAEREAMLAEYRGILDVARLALASGTRGQTLLFPAVAPGSDWMTIQVVLQATEEAAWERGYAAGRRPASLPF